MLRTVERRPTFREFAAELGLGWLIVLSVASVIFIIPSVLPPNIVPSVILRAVLIALAYACFWVAAYIVWRRERIARRVAERRLSVTFTFDTTHSQNYVPGNVFERQRIAVSVAGESGVERAVVKLTSISPTPSAAIGLLPDILRPVHVDGSNAREPFPMNPGDPNLIQVFSYVKGDDAHIRLHTTRQEIRLDLVCEYEIELLASGSPAQAITRRFKVGVANDRPFIVPA
jgi:hypothetical protein